MAFVCTTQSPEMLAIMKALNIGVADRVTKISIELEAGELAKVVIVRHLQGKEVDELVKIL